MAKMNSKDNFQWKHKWSVYTFKILIFLSLRNGASSQCRQNDYLQEKKKKKCW